VLKLILSVGWRCIVWGLAHTSPSEQQPRLPCHLCLLVQCDCVSECVTNQCCVPAQVTSQALCVGVSSTTVLPHQPATPPLPGTCPSPELHKPAALRNSCSCPARAFTPIKHASGHSGTAWCRWGLRCPLPGHLLAQFLHSPGGLESSRYTEWRLHHSAPHCLALMPCERPPILPTPLAQPARERVGIPGPCPWTALACRRPSSIPLYGYTLCTTPGPLPVPAAGCVPLMAIRHPWHTHAHTNIAAADVT
jgi:hypothetical protein